jgi:hypothetical protein
MSPFKRPRVERRLQGALRAALSLDELRSSAEREYLVSGGGKGDEDKL